MLGLIELGICLIELGLGLIELGLIELGFARFVWQKIGFSSRSANPIWSEKNHEDDRFPFLKIPSSSVFVLALKFTQISQNSAKSCVVLLQKDQLFVLKNHDFCKNKLKYPSISYKKACEKAERQNSLKSRNL